MNVTASQNPFHFSSFSLSILYCPQNKLVNSPEAWIITYITHSYTSFQQICWAQVEDKTDSGIWLQLSRYWCCYSRSSPEVQDESPTAFSSCPSKCLTGTSKLISLKSKVISLPPLKHYSSPSVSCLLRMAFTQQNCQKQFVRPVSPSCLQKVPGIQNPLISCTLNFFLICLFCFLLLLPFNGFFFISDLLPKLSLSKEFCSY